MSNIPTAESFLKENFNIKIEKHFQNFDLNETQSYQDYEKNNPLPKMYEVMIEFTKLHCIAQRDAILENVRIEYFLQGKDDFGDDVYGQKINKESILTAYPLDNIK